MPELSRRDFLVAAMAMGATVAASPRLEAAIRHVTGSGSPELFYFNAARARTCSAICARIVPSGTLPSKDPGSTEARAVVFIDRFLAALDHPPAGTHVSKKWRAQVGNLLPAPVSIRKTYADGLDAFDAYSKKTFGTPFASAASLEQ